MTKTYLVRGMLAGLLAGLCAISFAKLLGEPQIAEAERFEQVQNTREGKAPEKPLVSRDVQDTIGLGVGVAVAGVALGGLFGLAFAAAYGRIGRAGPRVTAGLLAAGAFVGVFVVPFLKYPANPPSVGDPATIGRRTALYFLMMAVGLCAVGLAAVVYRRLRARLHSWDAAVLATALFLVVVAVVYVVTPGIDEVPAGFPASVLWSFRVASAGTQLILWAVLGLCFGWMTERAEANGPRTRAARRALIGTTGAPRR
jgi:predicted cobalt transporter CbtA